MQLFLDVLYPVVLLMVGFGLIVVAEGLRQVFGGDTKLHRMGYRVVFVSGILLLALAPTAVVFTVFFGRHFILG